MNCEISEALKRLAGEYEHATTQKERDREGAHRRGTNNGRFEASMLSLDEHMSKFDDPSKVVVFSDGGKGAGQVRSCGGCEDVHSSEVDPDVKKRMLNKLRKYPHLQKTLRRFIRNATSEKRKPVKKTHIEKICEILF